LLIFVTKTATNRRKLEAV